MLFHWIYKLLKGRATAYPGRWEDCVRMLWIDKTQRVVWQCSTLLSCSWFAWIPKNPPWFVRWHTTSYCISANSLSIELLPSYPRMKGRASALHLLGLRPCLMSCPLGCSYEKRSLVGYGKMPCTIRQHPFL